MSKASVQVNKQLDRLKVLRQQVLMQHGVCKTSAQEEEKWLRQLMDYDAKTLMQEDDGGNPS